MGKIFMAIVMLFNYGVSLHNITAPYYGTIGAIFDGEYWEVDFYYNEETDSGYARMTEYQGGSEYVDGGEIESDMGCIMTLLVEPMKLDNRIIIIKNNLPDSYEQLVIEYEEEIQEEIINYFS